MATNDTPIYKLNNGNSDYYPLTVSSAVALDKPIIVKTAVGGFAAGEIITVATTIYQLLVKLFSGSSKENKYDKITIRTNKQGEMYVNRDALFKLDDLTLKEDGNNTISVNLEALIDDKVLTIKNRRITLDLSKLVDGDSLQATEDGNISINTEKFVRVDNDGIVKDSHGRISLNRKAIRIDGKYLYRDEHDRICFDSKYLNNYDPEFIIMDQNDVVTLNTDKVATVHTAQDITGFKNFKNGISVGKPGIDFENGLIESTDVGIIIHGLKDGNTDDTAVTKKFVLDKLSDSSTYLTIPMFEALNMKSCYEVQCNIKQIDPGTLDEFVGYRYGMGVTPGHIEVLRLRSSQGKDNMNVIVSWGDGSSTVVKNAKIIAKDEIGIKEGLYLEYSTNDNEKNYYLTHIYPEVDAKYIVSIYGNSYWGIHHCDEYPNLLCRIFASDLPIYNCVKSVSEIAIGAQRLLEVNLPAYFNFSEIQNFSSAFMNCLNLRRVNGFSKYIFTENIRYACSVFQNCPCLEYCDCHLAASTENWKKSNNNFFDGCTRLKSDLVDMLPSGGFCKKVVSMSETFRGCKNLICSDWDYVASILWNDNSTIWKNTDKCFIDCDKYFRENIPETWGGLKKVMFNDDIIIIKNMDEIYNLTKKIIDYLGLIVALDTDVDLYNDLRIIANQLNVKIDLKNDSQLVKTIETIVVSLGAKQLITLF